MRLSALFATLVFAARVLGAPPLKDVERSDDAIPGRYIVSLKPGVSRKAYADKLSLKPRASWDSINGFVADLSADALEKLRASPDVASISEDGVVNAWATQTNAPWGLSRLSQRAKLTNQSPSALTHTYTWSGTGGAGVDVYIVDTGIYTAHPDFGGRATWGVSYVGETTDNNGHGTHCAATAGGTTYGVAKLCNLIAVQVLNASGSGSNSGVISSLTWIKNAHLASGRPSVVAMPLGGSASTAVDNAVAALVAAGVHVVVAAGNNNANVANYSPARVPSAITVGGSTIADAPMTSSNYGAGIDVFAPGQNVISAWIGSGSATAALSGSSMATCYVAGLIAYLIGLSGNLSPAAMSTKVANMAVKNVLTGVPSGTVNYLAQNF